MYVSRAVPNIWCRTKHSSSRSLAGVSLKVEGYCLHCFGSTASWVFYVLSVQHFAKEMNALLTIVPPCEKFSSGPLILLMMLQCAWFLLFVVFDSRLSNRRVLLASSRLSSNAFAE